MARKNITQTEHKEVCRHVFEATESKGVCRIEAFSPNKRGSTYMENVPSTVFVCRSCGEARHFPDEWEFNYKNIVTCDLYQVDSARKRVKSTRKKKMATSA